MRQLCLGEGDVVRTVYVTLSRATYAKFKPQSTDFLAVSNPRAVLEIELRKFACLTKNDMIAVEVCFVLLVFSDRIFNAIKFLKLSFLAKTCF